MLDEAVRLFRNTREYLTPVLAESQFLSKALLTPEEFVQAGDHLIRAAPSWSWDGGEESKRRPYLPSNKQFLVLRGAPSTQRVAAAFSASEYRETLEVDETGESEPWCYTDFTKKAENSEDTTALEKELETTTFEPKEPPIESTKEAASESSASASIVEPAIVNNTSSEIQTETANLEEDDLALDDAAVTSTENGTFTVKERRYDVSITYDNYYRTPRVWLCGYDEDGSPLEPKAIFEVKTKKNLLKLNISFIIIYLSNMDLI
jgi:ubiquitin-like-conjugating enzyme ATG3